MLPLTLYVRTMPVGLANPNMLGPWPSAEVLAAIPSGARRAQTVTQARMNRDGNPPIHSVVRHRSSKRLEEVGRRVVTDSRADPSADFGAVAPVHATPHARVAFLGVDLLD